MKILGFDPGTARLGFGLVMKNGNDFVAGDYGIIETEKGLPKAERLRQIQADVEELLESMKPDMVAVEELFFVNNITTGISVAEARGVILATVARHGCEILEFRPMEIKQSICGNGHADKTQVQEMIKRLLKLESVPQPDDAADALAVAMTCGQTNAFLK